MLREQQICRAHKLAAALVDWHSDHVQEVLVRSAVWIWGWAAAEAKAGLANRAAVVSKLVQSDTALAALLFFQTWHQWMIDERKLRAKHAAHEKTAMFFERAGLRNVFEMWLSVSGTFKSQHEDQLSRARLATRLIWDGISQLLVQVLHVWAQLVRHEKLDARREVMGHAMASSQDRLGLLRAIFSAWHREYAKSHQALLEIIRHRSGIRSLAQGLSGLLERSCDEIHTRLVLQHVLQHAWKSWLCAATSGQAMTQDLLQQRQQLTMEEHLNAACGEFALRQANLEQSCTALYVRLKGAGRTMLLCLARGGAAELKIVFDTWRHQVRHFVDHAGHVDRRSHESAFGLICICFKRWRAGAVAWHRRLHVHQHAACLLSWEKAGSARVVLAAWQAAAARDHRRASATGAASRLVYQREATILSVVLVRWVRALVRRRAAKGCSAVYETMEKACRQAWMQALFTSWVDVLVIVQTAAIRLGIRQPQAPTIDSFTVKGLVMRREAVLGEQGQRDLLEAFTSWDCISFLFTVPSPSPH
ncbi:unnamed protein product [Polarella glacialis]|uniref:Uncharacterized protein n=1 Tax=Polarella glacialis TaxID=89957 RepID=A0A813KUD7_POLGL|nr:unnamed protein product [Polarella glacialis]